jgi:hypothetical protein
MVYSKKFKQSVSQNLKSLPYGKQKIVAKVLSVTSRTLRNRKRAKSFNKNPGPIKKAIRFNEQLKIAKEWKRQGYPGSRPVVAALPQLRIRSIREVISKLKSRRGKRRSLRKVMARKNIKVHHPGTVTSFDGATTDNNANYLVQRDRASLTIEVHRCDSHLKAQDTMSALTRLKIEDRLPFIVCTDNGSQLCADVVRDFLDKNYIIHLKNLPHVPQHNGACEIAVREFKEVFIENCDVAKTLKSLNENRKRKSLNWHTAKEFYNENFKTISTDERMKFYETTKSNISMATFGIQNAKEKRKLEREAIFKTMESFNLITITRGNQNRYPKAEKNS